MVAGRAVETEVLEGIWSRARHGDGCSLALIGDPGVGKTTLLRFLTDRAMADGARAAYVDGVRDEQGIPWGALSRLIHMLTPWPDDLAQVHADLLTRLSDLSPVKPGINDAVAAGSAVQALVESIAEARPLVIVIDDLQWIDNETATTVRYLARRLTRRRIALVTAADRPIDLELPEIVTVDRLGRDDTMRVIRDLLGPAPFSSTAARHVADQAAGNPARLRGIIESLSIGQRRGLEPLPDPLPGDEATLGAGATLSELPAAARRAVAALAMNAGDDTPLADLLTVADCTVDDVAVAERTGLVAIDHSRVRLTAARLRSLAYWTFPAPERRALHARWAEVVDDDVTTTMHRSRSTIGSDAELAVHCRSLARDAARRGDHVTAFGLRLQARSLQEETNDRHETSIEASESALALGDLAAARALLDTTDRSTEPARRLAVQAALAESELDLTSAIDRWASAIAVSRHDAPRLVARAAISGSVALFRQSQMTRALEFLDDVERSLDDVEPIERIQLDILRGVAEISAGRIDATTIGRAARYEELMARGDDDLAPILDVIGIIAISLAHFRQHDAARSVADRCERVAVERGLVTAGPAVATARCLTAFRSDLPGAAMYGALAVELAETIGCPHLGTMAESYLVAAEAHLGSPDTLAHIARLATRPDPVQKLAAAIATSGYWLTMGDAAKAFAAASAVNMPADATLVLSSRWLADLGEAAARSGQVDIARSAIERMRTIEGVEADDWLIGVIARTEAILAEPSEIDDLFALSVAAFERATNTLSVARTELLWGERLRRARRRSPARTHLERARQLFVEVGAGRWTERTERELLAAGAVADTPDHSRDADRVLTPQELQVARLAVAGASYREIAAQLFLSPRTVETHLSSVYRKIGVRNRAELSARAANDPALRPSP